MKKLFDELAYDVSKITTKKYSTSFSLGINALSSTIRPGIYAIYGFVRLADEIVDSFHLYNKEELLHRFKEQTWQALEEGISLNPILQSFQETVHKYQINHRLIEQFLFSMEMDLKRVQYDSELYNQYILGSAEVVGLMCLQVFVEGDKAAYEDLKPFAMKLGSAFQKINFLRDLKDDYHVLGRTYFPNLDMQNFSDAVKKEIEIEIEKEFKESLAGIQKLPPSSKFGVYLAYRYYYTLFRKIKNTPASVIANERIRIPDAKKISLMMRTYVQYKMMLI